MSEVTLAMTAVLGVGTQVITFITANPILTFVLAASLIPIGFRIFSQARHAA